MDETSAGPGAVRLVHDADRERYEALAGDELVAVLAHGDEDLPPGDGDGLGMRLRDLRSTVVAPERSGQGIGSAIVRYALDDIRGQGLKVRPTCWFVKGWIDRHPEYADLLESPPPAPAPPAPAPPAPAPPAPAPSASAPPAHDPEDGPARDQEDR